MVRKDRTQLSQRRTVRYSVGLCEGYLRQRYRHLCLYCLIIYFYIYLTIQRRWF